MPYNNYYNSMNYNRMQNRQSCPYNTQNNNVSRVSASRERKEPVDKMTLAMSYVPWQTWENIYDMDKGFCRGTIFADLDKPFEGGRC